MNYVIDFVRNEILMSAALSWGLAQVVKTIIHLILTKKFVAERLIGSGGMRANDFHYYQRRNSLSVICNVSYSCNHCNVRCQRSAPRDRPSGNRTQ